MTENTISNLEPQILNSKSRILNCDLHLITRHTLRITSHALLILLISLSLLACSSLDLPTATFAVPASPVPTVPISTPVPTAVQPSPGAAAAAFLEAWEAGDYAAMYALLSPPSQAAIDAAGFAERYEAALTTATVLTVTTRLQSAQDLAHHVPD